MGASGIPVGAGTIPTGVHGNAIGASGIPKGVSGRPMGAGHRDKSDERHAACQVTWTSGVNRGSPIARRPV